MIDPLYIQKLIEIVLHAMAFPDIDRAIPLLLGTAAVESQFQHFRQLGGGPARGLWQMEPATEIDHWRVLTLRKLHVAVLQCSGVSGPDVGQLQSNILYQIIMARTHYYVRDPQRLPEAGDIVEQARRWKRYYNTPAGAGTVDKYLHAWQTMIAPLWPPPEAIV